MTDAEFGLRIYQYEERSVLQLFEDAETAEFYRFEAVSSIKGVAWLVDRAIVAAPDADRLSFELPASKTEYLVDVYEVSSSHFDRCVDQHKDELPDYATTDSHVYADAVDKVCGVDLRLMIDGTTIAPDEVYPEDRPLPRARCPTVTRRRSRRRGEGRPWRPPQHRVRRHRANPDPDALRPSGSPSVLTSTTEGTVMPTSRPAAAAILILCALGALAGCNDDSPEARADSTSPTASTSPTESIASETPIGPQHISEGLPGVLTPGPYLFSFLTEPGVTAPEALVTVADGFTAGATWYIVPPDGNQFLGTYVVARVKRDACGTRNGFFDPGPSVKDLADALVAQKSRRYLGSQASDSRRAPGSLRRDGQPQRSRYLHQRPSIVGRTRRNLHRWPGRQGVDPRRRWAASRGRRVVRAVGNHARADQHADLDGQVFGIRAGGVATTSVQIESCEAPYPGAIPVRFRERVDPTRRTRQLRTLAYAAGTERRDQGHIGA